MQSGYSPDANVGNGSCADRRVRLETGHSVRPDRHRRNTSSELRNAPPTAPVRPMNTRRSTAACKNVASARRPTASETSQQIRSISVEITIAKREPPHISAAQDGFCDFGSRPINNSRAVTDNSGQTKKTRITGAIGKSWYRGAETSVGWAANKNAPAANITAATSTRLSKRRSLGGLSMAGAFHESPMSAMGR